MNFIDLLRGAGTVLFIVIIAGIIAYIGDRVGHQIGRKRLTVFNIRPRYTSTIIAVATGMIIALIVTLGAIFASNQVKTAFFRLNRLNSQISSLQATASALQAKVTNGRIVVPIESLLGGTARIPQNASQSLRRQIYRQFYRQTVAYVNSSLTRLGLRAFRPPQDADKLLDANADSPTLEAWLANSDVLLFAVADQNLYLNDPIHFGITAVPDTLIYHRGDLIAQEQGIPSGKNASAQLALAEMLTNFVPNEAVRNGFPRFFAGNVVDVQDIPPKTEMQRVLSGGQGTYFMSAFAASDIYPHTFGIPVVVTMQKAP